MSRTLREGWISMGSALAGAGLVTVVLFMVACGGGGKSSGPSAGAPEQLSFELSPLTPERTGLTVRYLGTATVRDRDNDLVGGCSEMKFLDSGERASFTLTAENLRGDCTVQCTFRGILSFENPSPGRIDMTHTVIDAAGRRSNELAFSVNISAAEQRQDGVPGTPGFRYEPVR